MAAFLNTSRQISFETEGENDWTDWLRADRHQDGVSFDASGVRKLDREECLSLALWLTEASRMIRRPTETVKANKQQGARRRGRPSKV
jgi:tagatose-1,6-bisphosphate aldolase non-catalytic subunit AgaZ/GatZ